ncbi:MAG: ADP-ribosylation/crystallin J1 [Pseudomonadota bacterium]|nr:ADP-ribosylation/crystallin J1 [Pseudomonadota bacterium]
MSMTVTLWRPVRPLELALIEESGNRAFPPRLPEQPFFYPVCSEEYAAKIARDWNVPSSGSGHVVRFEVLQEFLSSYPVQEAGGKRHREYWIPAGDLPELNDAIVGRIDLIRSFSVNESTSK